MPLPEAVGGQGVPGVGFIPPFACEFPVVEELELEFDPGPVVEVVPLVVPGSVPHGEPFGELPGIFDPLGFVVEGCVLLGVVELPGVPALGVVIGVAGAACGVAVPAGGVAVLAGGVAVLAGGVAGEPGVVVEPGVV